MTYSVYQHWDPLKVCVVGRSYPPEFYSWITVPHVRNMFERMAIETEEDCQKIIKKLESFGVTVLRPNLPRATQSQGKFIAPPMTPRDHTVMVGSTFYHNFKDNFSTNYNQIKDPSWPVCDSWQQFEQLPAWIVNECAEMHGFVSPGFEYQDIFLHLQQQGNMIKQADHISGAMLARLGKDLYLGTDRYDQDPEVLKQFMDTEFPNTRNHVVNTGGHSDGTYCPVCPGLILSTQDVPTYADTFPDWEVVYLPPSDLSAVKSFADLKEKNKGKWWIPGFEKDQEVIDVVETWLGHWTGFVEETVFDVNMLIVDPKNVIVFNYDKQVFDALDRYGITAHVILFRHRYFWDGGIHCITSDLHREGTMQNYFPERL